MNHLRPRGVVLHVTASTFGDAAEVNAWHLGRGFARIGYHAVILNGVRKSFSKYTPDMDGAVQAGRTRTMQGAHCLARGMNGLTLGVCLVGNPGQRPQGPAASTFELKPYLTARQSETLVDELARLCLDFGWNPQGTFRHQTGASVAVITQHSDHDPAKPFCASLNLPVLRAAVARRLVELQAAT